MTERIDLNAFVDTYLAYQSLQNVSYDCSRFWTSYIL